MAGLAVVVVAFVVARPGSGGGDKGSSGPVLERIQIAHQAVVGGPKSISIHKGERLRIVVSSDAPDALHLHGFDIERTARPGRPARFAVTANQEGVFELESHTFEHAGKEPAVARIAVRP